MWVAFLERFSCEKYDIHDKYNERLNVYFDVAEDLICSMFEPSSLNDCYVCSRPNAAIEFMNALHLLCGKLFADVAIWYEWPSAQQQNSG